MVAQDRDNDTGERIDEWLESHLWAFWLGVLVLIIAPFQLGPWSVIHVKGTAMQPLLTSDAHYITKDLGAVCAGDPVVVTHPDGHSAVRIVMALGGDTVVLTETGYRVARTSVSMTETWRAAAREAMGDATTVPRNRIMLRRANPDVTDGKAYEALFIVAPQAVEGIFTRSLNGERGFLARVPRPGARCTAHS